MNNNVQIQEYDDFINCDGKKCGLGKHVASGKYLCSHNNLEVKHPELVKQWHPDNKPMDSYLSGSRQKVLWICNSDKNCGCHIWPAEIRERTRTGRKPSGCPFCSKYGKMVCKHDNLEVLFSHLKIEWDPNNIKQMCEYSCSSGDIVSWICSANKCNCHTWKTSIYKRTKKDDPSGCPFCNTGRICEHNNLEINFPELKIEWHPDNFKQMKEFSPAADVKVKWICSKNLSHIWEAVIYSRTREDAASCSPLF